MLDKKSQEIIQNFSYMDWESYILYKFRDNPYLSAIEMDREHSYTYLNYIQMYESLPKNIDEFSQTKTRKEDYFFLGFDYESCELIQMRHQVYPYLKEQNYDKMTNLINVNQDHSSSIRQISFAIIDYFFHFHILPNSIYEEDEDFFLDISDLLPKNYQHTGKHIQRHLSSHFDYRERNELPELCQRTYEYLGTTHQLLKETPYLGHDAQTKQNQWYYLIEYEQLLAEKEQLEKIIEPTNLISLPKRKI